MPVRELAHTTKTTSEKPRGRIRIQLDTPPKKQRGVRAWPVFDREAWSDFWYWHFDMSIIFNSLAVGGLVFFFAGPFIGIIIGIEPDASISPFWWWLGGSLGPILVAGAILPFCDD